MTYRGKLRGATLDGHSTPATRGRRATLSDNLNCDEKNGPWRHKKGPKIGYGGMHQ